MDDAQVTRILGGQFPELAGARVSYLGEGCDSTAFEVDGSWIFRFPKRADVEAQLLVERAILPALAPRLPLPIPDFQYHGAPSAEFPFHFAGYRKLVGEPGLSSNTADLPFDAIAAAMGRFLSRLHEFPVTDAARLGVRSRKLEDYFEEVRAESLEHLDIALCVAPDSPVELWRRYLTEVPPLAPPPWPLTLTHNDLAAEHILLDPATREPTGVIDWGDVSIGDPTIDFLGLYYWNGEGLLRAALAGYSGTVDERVVERVRPWTVFRAVGDIRFGVEHNLSDYTRTGLRALRALTPA